MSYDIQCAASAPRWIAAVFFAHWVGRGPSVLTAAACRTASHGGRICLLLILALAALPLRADVQTCMWYVDDDSVRQVDTVTNLVRSSVYLRDPHRLHMNGEDCGVWVLHRHDRVLLRYGPDGALDRRIRLREIDQRIGEAEHSALDAADGGLWLADDRWLARLDASGQLQRIVSLPFAPRRIAVGLDRSLWLLGANRLLQFDAEGTERRRVALAGLTAEPRRLFVDDLHDRLWIVGRHRLVQLELSDPQAQPRLLTRIDEEIEAAALDPYAGELWLATHSALLKVDAQGVLQRRVELAPYDLRRPEKLAFDPVGRNLWAGFQRKLARFGSDAQLQAVLPARDGDEALGVPALRIEPQLTLLRPVQDALLSEARPLIQLGIEPRCNAQACTLATGLYRGARLDVSLNAAAVGARFVSDEAGRSASYTPADRLPEGRNLLSAVLTDRFGRQSAQLTAAFNIDTVPPSFVELIPATGSVLTQPALTIQGRTDEAAGVAFENAAEFNAQGANPQDTLFAWNVALKPGTNIARLAAVDRAGNSTTQNLSVSYVPPGVRLTIDSPIAGALINEHAVLVSGSFEGPSTIGITINGNLAALAGNRFQAVVPLQAGENLITVSVTTLEGLSTTKSVTVTANLPAVRIQANPNPAITGTQIGFTVSSGETLNRIEADFDGNGTYDLTYTTRLDAIRYYLYAAPGTYQARFRLTDTLNQASERTVTVVVQDGMAIDSQIRAVFGEAMNRLRQGDIDGAAIHFTQDAAEKYRPVFTELGAELPTAVDRIGTLAHGSIVAGFAEYLIVRETTEGNKGFLIYFMQDPAGLWRISAM